MSKKKTRTRPAPRVYVRTGPPVFPPRPERDELIRRDRQITEQLLRDNPYGGMTADMIPVARRHNAGEPLTPLELVWFYWACNGPPEEVFDRVSDEDCFRVEALFEQAEPLTAEDRAWVDGLVALCGYENDPEFPLDQLTWDAASPDS